MSLRYARAFVFIGVTGLLFGAMLGLSGLPLVWFGATMLAIGANYAFPQRFVVFRKKNGQLAFACKVLLLPYLVMLYGVWHLIRKTSSEPAFAELAPGLLIGRRLLPHEVPPVATIVDLTAELDEHVPNGATLLALPILDGAPVDPVKLVEMAKKIHASEGPIYLHCAQGHGRTSMVAAAVLLERGLAKNVAEALEMIRRVRPGAKPNRDQRRALEAAYPG